MYRFLKEIRMNEQDSSSQGALGQNIEMLEQILEVMPDDLVTLRALYETSVKLGDSEKAFKTLTRLDDQARAAQNADMIDFVLQQYEQIGDDSSEIQGRMARLREIKTASGLLQDEAESAAPAAERRQDGDSRLDAEMALAWDLFQDDQLSQDEYSNVLHDLTELSSQHMGVPVTVLHILRDRQFGRMERMITHLSQKHEIPVMMLSFFEGNEDACRQMPLEFVSGNAILPFEKVGGELLVAVLNPLDHDLVEEAQALCGTRCHRYLVSPDEYDQQIARLKTDLP